MELGEDAEDRIVEEAVLGLGALTTTTTRVQIRVVTEDDCVVIMW